jgi:YHS domain-containing protein
LPTTVILAPTAQGEVLAVIPDDMPADQYLSRLNKVAADAKRRNAPVFAQIQPSPAVGAPAGLGQPPVLGPPPSISTNPVRPVQTVANLRPPAEMVQNPAPPPVSPAPNMAGPSVAAPPTSPPNSLAASTGPTVPASRPIDPPKTAADSKPPTNPLFGLDGFCPVQLVENARWQPGQRAWGAIHRGRTYLFAGPEERNRFMANPDRYAPVSSGDDVVLMLEQGRSVSGHRDHGAQFEGHVYLFASEETLAKFCSNPHYYADRALQALRPAPQPSQAAIVR